MQFTNLNIFSILLFIILLIIIIFFSFLKYKNQIIFNKKFQLLSCHKYFYIKYIFLIFSFLIILFSIFWLKYNWEKGIRNASWIDIMFVLDVSKSMNVADINSEKFSATRLDVAKKSIWDFIVKNKQNRFWLVIFAWDAISTIPLTTDHSLFLTFLENVDYRNLSLQGSDFKKALNLWVERFNFSDENRSKALVFISDWWDVEDNIKTWSFIDFTEKKIIYSVVWIWTENWWKIIKWRDPFWRLQYQKYQWQYVISKINRENLKNISDELSSDYFEIEKISDLEYINSTIKNLEKKAIKVWNSKKLLDSWRFLTFISFTLFLVFLIIYFFEKNLIKKEYEQ